jgi:hypothetical protein
MEAKGVIEKRYTSDLERYGIEVMHTADRQF